MRYVIIPMIYSCTVPLAVYRNGRQVYADVCPDGFGLHSFFCLASGDQMFSGPDISEAPEFPSSPPSIRKGWSLTTSIFRSPRAVNSGDSWVKTGIFTKNSSAIKYGYNVFIASWLQTYSQKEYMM